MLERKRKREGKMRGHGQTPYLMHAILAEQVATATSWSCLCARYGRAAPADLSEVTKADCSAEHGYEIVQIAGSQASLARSEMCIEGVMALNEGAVWSGRRPNAGTILLRLAATYEHMGSTAESLGRTSNMQLEPWLCSITIVVFAGELPYSDSLETF